MMQRAKSDFQKEDDLDFIRNRGVSEFMQDMGEDEEVIQIINEEDKIDEEDEQQVIDLENEIKDEHLTSQFRRSIPNNPSRQEQKNVMQTEDSNISEIAKDFFL